MSQGAYSAGLVAVIVGNHIVQGFVEDSHISAAYDNDRVSLKEGTDGHVAVSSRPRTRLGTITIRLDQTSMSNNILSALGVTGSRFAVQVLNAQGGEIAFITEALIKKEPNVDFGRETSPREWTFAGQLTMFSAGFAV